MHPAFYGIWAGRRALHIRFFVPVSRVWGRVAYL
jgi:hypothetical protein